MSSPRPWSFETQVMLENAGWSPYRREARRVDDWKRAFSEHGEPALPGVAEQILLEFGGIEMRVDGPGLHRARGGLRFDPTLALGEAERFGRHSAKLGTQLFPLGEAFDGHAFLGTDSAGKIYLVGDELEFVGEDIYGAVEAILQGTHARRRPVAAR